MIIDAHQHLWRIGQSAWPTPDLGPIHRDFEIDDLLAAVAPLGVAGSVLVQSQESDRDTDWLLSIAEASPFVRAVVGWADLKAENAPARIAELAARPKLCGLRPMLQAHEPDWILDPAVEPAIETMIRCGLRFDALVRPQHLPALRAFAARHSDLPIVIDHCAKPPIAAGELSPWREEIAALARSPNVFCKLSGLLTEAGRDQPREALHPYTEHVVAAFGADRLMWGSDWPVLLLAGEYQEWFDMARQLSGLRSAALDALMGGSAARFYGLAA
jgi:L-fuconolactonase